MALRLRSLLAGFAAAVVVASAGSPRIIAAFGDAKTLTLYNIHTKETASFLFKKDGRFVPSGLKKANYILRDWRRNEPTRMDPALLDLLWEIHTELGSKKPIHIISGYRSLATNNQLRRTRGGQAKKSRHIVGKAADVHFPDVPVKKLRYSALVRERGGVGYYPTSALPFVHIDTGRVRHWPRMRRYELALLFPDGRTKHRPARGGPVTSRDVSVAQARFKTLSVQIARFHESRKLASAPPVLVASNKGSGNGLRVAALPPPPAAAPRLVSAPRLARRLATGRLPAAGTRPTAGERGRLAELALAGIGTPFASEPARAPRVNQRVASLGAAAIGAAALGAAAPEYALYRRAAPGWARITPARQRAASPASAAPAPTLFRRAAPGWSAEIKPAAAVLTPARNRQVAALTKQAGRPVGNRATDGWSNGWAQAPAFDSEHPDELSYRPFPIAPFLTQTASSDDPALSRLTHPDAARTLDFIDGVDKVPPLRFSPGRQIAQLLYAQQFSGRAVNLSGLYAGAVDAAATKAAGLTRRRVRTRGG